MGRNYSKVLRERGIPTDSESRPAFTDAKRAWRAMTNIRRREFMEWAGLRPDPSAGTPETTDHAFRSVEPDGLPVC